MLIPSIVAFAAREHHRVRGAPGRCEDPILRADMALRCREDAWRCPWGGGLAAQQADAVAEAVAASLGVRVVPRSFRPVLHGLLVTDGVTYYMRASVGAEDCAVSESPLWCRRTG